MFTTQWSLFKNIQLFDSYKCWNAVLNCGHWLVSFVACSFTTSPSTFTHESQIVSMLLEHDWTYYVEIQILYVAYDTLKCECINHNETSGNILSLQLGCETNHTRLPPDYQENPNSYMCVRCVTLLKKNQYFSKDAWMRFSRLSSTQFSFHNTVHSEQSLTKLETYKKKHKEPK